MTHKGWCDIKPNTDNQQYLSFALEVFDMYFRITDNSLQDKSPHIKLAPRQLAQHIRQLASQVKVDPPSPLVDQVPISLFNSVKPKKI